MRKRFFKNSPNFTPFGAPIGASLFANLNPHSPKMLEFGWNQFSGFGEVI